MSAPVSSVAIAERLGLLRARIVAAAVRVGRSPDAIRLVAVAKTFPPEAIRAAHAAGQREFGENYMQELVDKASALSDLADIRWRFIGHLQTNKAKDAVRLGSTVDTVDSERLAEALARRAEGAGSRLGVLLEVNVGGEAHKAGCPPERLDALVSAVRRLPALDLRGLFAIPPPSEDPDATRPHFRRLRELALRYDLAELSMGMSHDFETAIEEGATLVRIGTAIFGER